MYNVYEERRAARHTHKVVESFCFTWPLSFFPRVECWMLNLPLTAGGSHFSTLSIEHWAFASHIHPTLPAHCTMYTVHSLTCLPFLPHKKLDILSLSPFLSISIFHSPFSILFYLLTSYQQPTTHNQPTSQVTLPSATASIHAVYHITLCTFPLTRPTSKTLTHILFFHIYLFWTKIVLTHIIH